MLQNRCTLSLAFTVFLVLLLSQAVLAQQGNIWAFGINAGIDFNRNPPVAIKTDIESPEGTASISDDNGRLLFYSDGQMVWDRNDQVMPNGSDLPGLGVAFSSSTAQGTLIVPVPGNAKQYYIFSLESLECMSGSPLCERLFYSLVDMTLNNGLGDVVADKKGIQMDSLLTEHMIGVAGDNCDIWVIVVSRSKSFRAFNIDSKGINMTPVISSCGIRSWADFVGSIDIAPNRKKLAIGKSDLVLYNFNAASGEITDPVVLSQFGGFYGISFSPDNTKLYVGANYSAGLFQYDLSSNDEAKMSASRKQIGYGLTMVCAVKRGPDGKIYCATSSDTLGVINQPDSIACQYVANGLPLAPGTISRLGLPNSLVVLDKENYLKVYRSQEQSLPCAGSRITLVAMDTSGINYFWDNGDTGTTRSINNTGTYWVRYLVPSASCAVLYTDSFKVDLPPPVLAILSEDTVVCEGTDVFIRTQVTAGYRLSWSPTTGVNDSTAAEPVITIDEPNLYVVTASFPGCPDMSAMIEIGMQHNPVVDLGTDQFVCEGAPVALTSSVRPYRNDYLYQWAPKDLGLPHRANITALADSSITYSLTVQTTIGCMGTDSIRFTVIPGHFGSIISDTGYCPPGILSLWAKGGTSYLWYPSYGLNDTTLAEPEASPWTTTTYNVVVREEHGCLDSLSVSIEVWPRAVLAMEDSLNLYPGEAYHLQPATNCLYFHWFPPSGMSNTEVADPWLSPEVRTRYFVTAVTEHGCKLEDSIDVLVQCTVMAMPNVFAPTSGSNNTFKAAIRGIVELKSFSIFNRWGNEVFETKDITEGWDGTYKGQVQPLGVYVYKIEAISECGLPYYKEGNVTLLR